MFGDTNVELATIYEKCEPHEEVLILLFLNDKTTFDRSFVPAMKEALDKWSYANEAPKKHLEFVLELLEKHEKITIQYAGFSTATVTMVTDNPG